MEPTTPSQAEPKDNEKLVAFVKTVRELGQGLTEYFNRAIQAITPQLELFGKAMLHFAEALDRLPPRVRLIVIGAAQRGWYIPWDVPLTWMMKLEKALAATDHDELDATLCEVFCDYPAQIVKDAYTRFPERRVILEQAFAAHIRGEYFLSVPVFLAQAEGIAIGCGVPGPFDNRPETHKLLRGIEANSMLDVLIAPLIAVDSIRLGRRALDAERVTDPRVAGLNRHEVMHGYSTQYGTLPNSTKAALLIGYILTISERLLEERPSDTANSVPTVPVAR